MANVNDYPVTNGDIIDSDNQVVNIVDLLGGGTPVLNQTLNKNDFPIHSGLVIGSDNKLYDLAQLISGSGTDVAEVEKIANTEVLFNEKLPIYEVINSQYKTNTLLFVEGIEGYTQTVQLTIAPSNSARVNWGDDSDPDFIREETTLTHTYEKEGKYIIKIESPSGGVYVLSGNAIVLTNCNLVKAQFGYSCNVRNGLSFPAQNLTDLYTEGQADFNFSIFQNTKLKEFYINNLEGTVTIPNDSFRYSTIEKITISNNIKTFGNWVFPNNIKEIHIETDPSNPYINFNYTDYTFSNISEYTPVYIPYGTKEYFETNLPYFKNYIEVVDDIPGALDKKLNESIVDVTVLPTGSNIKDVIYRIPVYENTSVTYDFTQTNIDNIFSVDFNDFSCLTVEDTSPDVDTPQYRITPKTGETVFVNMGAGVGDETLEFIAYGREDNENWGEIKTNLGWYHFTNETGTFTLKTPNDYKLYAGNSTNQTTTELGGSVEEPTASEIEAYEADILSVIS